MEPLVRSYTDNSWVFIILLSIIAVLGISKMMFQHNYASLRSLTFFQENQENFFPFAIMINLILISLVSLVLYPFIDLTWEWTNWSSTYNIFGLISAWFLVRFLINTFIIFVLGLGDNFRDIVQTKIYFRFFGVILLIVSVLFLYYSDFSQQLMFYISMGIVGSMFLSEYIFQLRKNGLTALYGSYYFILYLCTLEILPILYVIREWIELY